jgi:tetratricopeptide (TPR) repeat protein
VFSRQRRFADATRQFAGGQRAIEAVASVDPNKVEYQKNVAESLAWLADAQRDQGRILDATGTRQRQVDLLTHLATAHPGDVEYRQKLIPAEQALGRLLAIQGKNEAAANHLRAATALADQLIPLESDNSRIVEYGATAHLALALHLLRTSQAIVAAPEAGKGCELVRRLLAKRSAVLTWQTDELTCLVTQARLSLTSAARPQAVNFARQALALSITLKSGDAIEDRYVIAGSRLLLGETLRQSGDVEGARREWTAALGLLPAAVSERPWETAVRADLLSRTGNAAAASRLNATLAAAGVRSKDLLRM